MLSIFIDTTDTIKSTEKTVYSFFDMLGDIGGLNDCLLLMIKFFVAPYTASCLNSHLLSQNFVTDSRHFPKSRYDKKIAPL